jgi:hypothetical protein
LPMVAVFIFLLDLCLKFGVHFTRMNRYHFSEFP